jgi:hypothetical protein
MFHFLFRIGDQAGLCRRWNYDFERVKFACLVFFIVAVFGQNMVPFFGRQGVGVFVKLVGCVCIGDISIAKFYIKGVKFVRIIVRFHYACKDATGKQQVTNTIEQVAHGKLWLISDTILLSALKRKC